MYNELANKYILNREKLEICTIPVSTNLEIAKIMAVYEATLRYRPTVLFQNVTGCQYDVLMNPFKRRQMIRSFDFAEEEDWLASLYARYQQKSGNIIIEKNNYERLESIHALPLIKHQPMDCGFYITCGITITKNIETDQHNLGIYRIRIFDDGRATIFLNEASDGYQNFKKYAAANRSMPVSIVIGAEMPYYMIGASKLPYAADDFTEAARLLAEDIVLYDFDTNMAPAGQFVLTGQVLNQQLPEGNFGEFKGYYVHNNAALELRIDDIYCNKNPLYMGLSAGKESGLTLSAMQGEWLLYKGLRDAGYDVLNIVYRIEEAGEFVAVITSARPSVDLIEAAFDSDPRLKFVFCGYEFSENPWKDVSILPFQIVTHAYTGSTRFADNGQKAGFYMLDYKKQVRVEL